ncbi:MAG: hypothetical protein ACXABY_17700 [Candidatus Thorarchaeota archaeon]|jgi:hypothetical protein
MGILSLTMRTRKRNGWTLSRDPDGQLILYTGVYSDFAKAVANTSKALDEHDGVEREDEFGQRV